MSDLTERLRKPMSRKNEWVFHDYEDGRSEGPFDPIRLEAADEIDRLTRELAEARDKALEEAAFKLRALMEECDADSLRWALDKMPSASKISHHHAGGVGLALAAVLRLKEKP